MHHHLNNYKNKVLRSSVKNHLEYVNQPNNLLSVLTPSSYKNIYKILY